MMRATIEQIACANTANSTPVRPLYAIKDWNKHFENSESRKIQHVKWAPMPNKHDGKSYRRISRRPDGPVIFCGWCLIVQLASKMPTRGILADADGPLTPEDMALKTGFAQDVFDLALQVLTAPEIGWIYDIHAESSGAHPVFPGNSGAELNGREGKGTEEEHPTDACTEPAAAVPTDQPPDDGSDSQDASPIAMRFLIKKVGKGKHQGKSEWLLTEAKLAEYREAFPDLDLPRLLRFIRQWVIDNPPKRKTYGGMPAFLTRWMGNEMDKPNSRFRRNGPIEAGDLASEREITSEEADQLLGGVS